ncbi:MAG: SH3 domain-containing protein [Sulfitobacter sp.]
MIRLALLLWCIAGSAFADNPAWPALYDVVDLADDDVPNIRSKPDASAPLIGALDPKATDIGALGQDPQAMWAKINADESTGWVALRYLSRQPDQTLGQPLQIASCFGTEPFWTLELSDIGNATYSALGEEDQRGNIEARLSSQNSLNDNAVAIRFGQRTSIAMISRTDCSDGMSDRTYGLRVQLLHGSNGPQRLLSGCCTLVP